MWTIFFVVLVGGGIAWSASTWMRARSSRDTPSASVPMLVLVTFTPAAHATITATVEATATLSLTATPVVTATLQPDGAVPGAAP